MQVVTYLTFPGTCEEAFSLYADTLGGKVGELFRYSGTDLAKQVPADWGKKVMHGSVTFGDQTFMGADAAPGHFKPPQGFSISIHLNDTTDAKRIFKRLAEGGKVTMPLEKTFWADLFGQVIDRFGIEWAINCGDADPS